MHEQRVRALKEQVEAALAGRRGLAIRGAGTRAIGTAPSTHEGSSAESLGLRSITGVLAWEPEELVVSVASGTPLAELEATLAERRQRLLGEPWSPSAAATVGGAVATGFSGPGRPWLGSVSDGVLGVRLLTAPEGRCVDGRFGGRVIKNVAGFDVSRLQVGACGIFGVFGASNAVELTYLGLYAQQHRGQESAGIASVQNGRIASHKDMGLVGDVFDDAATGQGLLNYFLRGLSSGAVTLDELAETVPFTYPAELSRELMAWEVSGRRPVPLRVTARGFEERAGEDAEQNRRIGAHGRDLLTDYREGS